MNKMDENAIINLNNNKLKLEYIGYYKMLDKILELIDKTSYDNKIILIEKYIELVKEIKKENKNG